MGPQGGERGGGGAGGFEDVFRRRLLPLGINHALPAAEVSGRAGSSAALSAALRLPPPRPGPWPKVCLPGVTGRQPSPARPGPDGGSRYL